MALYYIYYAFAKTVNILDTLYCFFVHSLTHTRVGWAAGYLVEEVAFKMKCCISMRHCIILRVFVLLRVRALLCTLIQWVQDRASGIFYQTNGYKNSPNLCV